MQQRSYPFEKLPFSPLFKAYTERFSSVEQYYDYNPYDEEDLAARSRDVEQPESRERLEELVRSYNGKFEITPETEENISLLGEEGTLALVTGQQLSLFGGPLYTVFKTVTAIRRAAALGEKLGRMVIPVFWLADEDHDYEEVRHCGLINGDRLQHVSLPESELEKPVSERSLPSELEDVREEVGEVLHETDFTEEVGALLDRSYVSGETFSRAFGNFLMELFGSYGLVLMGSNNGEIKEAGREVMSTAVRKADEIRRVLEEQSSSLEKNYHRQVTLYDSHLFYLSSTGERRKISRSGDRWEAGGEAEWTEEELLEEIRDRPDRFSPNVFLRPLMQDRLLPTLGYVAGPGEIAYYGQMKPMYRCFGQKMPPILPRLSATMIEPSIDRIMKELPFEFHEYQGRIEDLESQYVQQTEQLDIEALFSDWKQEVERVAERGSERVSDVDPTLEGAAGKAMSVYFGELDKLKGKVYRSVKQQEQTQLERIRKIKAQLFPGNGLQEREVASLYFMNKYGVDLWDRLLEALDEEESYRRHKLINL